MAKKRKEIPPKKRRREDKGRGRARGAYDAGRFDEEDLLELDEEEEFLREDADSIEDEIYEEEMEAPIEDLAESLDADTWDRAGSEETLTEEAEKTDESEEEELLTDDEVRDFTQEFERIPEDIADLEAEEPAPKEYDAYEDDEYYDEEDESEEEEEDEYTEGETDDEEVRDTATGRGKSGAFRRVPRRGARRGRNRAGKGGREKQKLRLTAFEWVAIATSGLLVVAAISMGVLFVRVQAKNAQAEAFQEIGADLADLRIIGESGLIAMRDAAALRLAESSMEEFEEEEEEIEAPEMLSAVEVSMTLTTIKSDLKIKFTNAETGKLIANVPFAVTAKAPSGKTETWTDDDRDGVIYKTGISAGTWSITMQELDASYTESYLVSTKPKTASVKDTIEYKKVDVSDEIKKESQVNTAVEDTEPKAATAVESVNADTVEWVESSREEIGGDENVTYQPVDKDKIEAPGTARLTVRIGRAHRASDENAVPNPEKPEGTGSGEGSGENTENTENTENGGQGNAGEGQTTPEEIKTAVLEIAPTLEITVDETGSISITKKENLDGETISWTSSNTAIATVDGSGKVTAVKAGTTTVTASAGSASASCAVTVKEKQTVVEKKISVSALTVYTGSKGTLSVTSEGLNEKKYLCASSDESIATVSSDGVVKGVKAGKVTITVTAAEDSTVRATCEVTVTEGGTLKTKSGETVYVKSGDSYRPAVAADYYVDNITFYLKNETAKNYIYHGWQTIDGYTYYYDKNGNYVTGDQVILGVKYHFSSDGVLSSGSGALGVDVSKWNGNIDWNAVKNSGVSYAIIRCGYRGTSTGVLVEDSKFRSNIQGALNAGLKVGVYFYSAAVNDVEGVQEASMALSLCNGYRLSYPIFLDVERSDSGNGRADRISAADRTAAIKAFCATIAGSGYKAGLYANKSWMESMIDTPSLTGYKLWLAQYAAAPTYSRTRYDMWQYTSQGAIGGISGKVDLNVSYLGY